MILRIVRSVVAAVVRLLTGTYVLPSSAIPSSPCIVIANHSSHLDTMVIWSMLPAKLRSNLRPAGGADYWLATPLRTWFFLSVLNGIPIERRAVTKSNNPIDDLVKGLERGNSILIFPEGTRSITGELGAFRSGIYHLAQALPQPTPILPIGLVNLQRIMPKGEVVPVPLICTARIGSVIYVQADESKTSFLERCRSAVYELITEGRKNVE